MGSNLKKVLLIEPGYCNKYPPIGLMKIATYYRNRGGWEVMFYKGDLKDFVIERTTDKCLRDLNWVEEADWNEKRDKIAEYIKTRKTKVLEFLALDKMHMGVFLRTRLDYWKDYYWKGEWKNDREWDRVGVTTLFTFYWDKTIETIEFAKLLVKDTKDLMVGGVLASIQQDEIYKATGIRPWKGILGPGDLDPDDTQDIDNLPLDYSILDEIDYKYPMANAFYGYTTRGCIRHCPFCAVPILEPQYNDFIPLKKRLKDVRDTYGDKKDLLLMDNNVLASKCFDNIIEDIIESGFARGAKFVEPNQLELTIKNLKAGTNDRAYSKKAHFILEELCDTLAKKEPYKDDSYAVYLALQAFNKGAGIMKDNIINACESVLPIYTKHHHPTAKQRYVDFNQGVDARLFDDMCCCRIKRLFKLSALQFQRRTCRFIQKAAHQC